MSINSTLALIAAPFLVILSLLFGLIVLAGGGSTGLPAACEQARPSAAGQPPLTQYYIDAAHRFRLGADGYAYLAAINKIETGFGTDVAVSPAGAVGWMQFEPATYTEYSQVAGATPDVPADPDDPRDAIYTAAAMLRANGAPGNWPKAIFAYNHANWYVSEVQTDADRYIGINGLTNLAADIAAAWGTSTQPQTTTHRQSSTEDVSYPLSPGCPGEVLDVAPVPGRVAVIMPNGLARPPRDAPVAVQAMVDAGDRITAFDYQWGGGHATQPNRTAKRARSRRVGQNRGRTAPRAMTAQGQRTMCCGAAGTASSILAGTDPASGELMTLGAAGADPEGWVTWYANAGTCSSSSPVMVLDTVHGPTTVRAEGRSFHRAAVGDATQSQVRTQIRRGVHPTPHRSECMNGGRTALVMLGLLAGGIAAAMLIRHHGHTTSLATSASRIAPSSPTAMTGSPARRGRNRAAADVASPG